MQTVIFSDAAETSVALLVVLLYEYHRTLCVLTCAAIQPHVLTVSADTVSLYKPQSHLLPKLLWSHGHNGIIRP